jgi:hypothetical protein
MGQIGSRIRPMVSTGLRPLLETLVSQPRASHLLGMAQHGWREVKEVINSPIRPMESTGLRQLLGMGLLQLPASQSHGMGHSGLLEGMEQIK